MLFKKITDKIARESINDFLMNHYGWKYRDLKKFIKFRIDKTLFKKFTKKGLSKKDMIKISSRLKRKDSGKSIDSIEKQWNSGSGSILNTAHKITGIKIDDRSIICYVDPYTNLGFYSKKDISEVLICAEKLLILFYFMSYSTFITGSL
jgi:hypothetical protein